MENRLLLTLVFYGTLVGTTFLEGNLTISLYSLKVSGFLPLRINSMAIVIEHKSLKIKIDWLNKLYVHNRA